MNSKPELLCPKFLFHLPLYHRSNNMSRWLTYWQRVARNNCLFSLHYSVWFLPAHNSFPLVVCCTRQNSHWHRASLLSSIPQGSHRFVYQLHQLFLFFLFL